MTTTTQAWASLTERMTELRDLGAVGGILSWDQHVWMPRPGGAYRGRQKALLSRLGHEWTIDPALGEWLAVLADDPETAADPVRSAAVRNVTRTRKRALKVPASLVAEKAHATSTGFAAWVSAREQNDFNSFVAPLSHIISLVRQEARCLSAPDAEHPYDALVDRYDPGLSHRAIAQLFDPLTAALRDLLGRIREAPPIAHHPVPVSIDAQRRIHRTVATALGFDLDKGRLDEAPHPFTMGIGPQDVRLTTRYFADDLLAGLLGTVHEAGHGMYEQGLPETIGGHSLTGTTVGRAASTGVHESQSRFWENVIARSRPFVGWLARVVQDETGQAVDADAVYASANRVAPSHIRVEADEVTYNLHIAMRVQLEAALLAEDLDVADLEGAWNDLAEQFLGLRPQRAADGVLQDVHWGSGLIGYFPSYTLGNLYAAVLTERIEEDLPDLWAGAGRGELQPVLDWLRQHVHSQGHLIDGPALIQSIAPGRDPVAALVAHFEGRHGRLYGVA